MPVTDEKAAKARNDALQGALTQIERQFGKGSVMRMNDRAQVAIGAVSTGSLSLDLALGQMATLRAPAAAESSLVTSVATRTKAANIPGDPVNVVSSGPSENSTSPCRT